MGAKYQFMVDKNQIVETFNQLVKIDSLSLQEKNMGEKLIQELKKTGCQVMEDDIASRIDGNSGNIIADFPGDNKLPSLLLCAHMDRVKPGKNIEPAVKDGYIISKGDTVLAADDLAGVTAILEALKIIKSENIPHGHLKIIFTVAEEQGLLGAKNLSPSYYTGLDFGFVFDAEGPVGSIIYKGPTKSRFNAVINGKASHAAIAPEKGINAIKIASLAISAMNLGKIDEDTTANIGVIRGGVASNVIPDFVELEGEVRSHHKEKLNQQIEHMQNKLNKYIDKYHGEIKYDIETLYKSFSLNLESKLIKLLTEAAKSLELEAQYVKTCGGNDANIFNARGLPTVSLGIGSMNVHSKDEKIKIAELLNLVKYAVTFIDLSRKYVE